MNSTTLFLVLLFFSVFFISQALILPAAGKNVKHKELAKRLRETHDKLDDESKSLLREHYLKGLSPFERKLISFSFFADFKRIIDLSGVDIGLARLLNLTLMTSMVVGLALLLLGQFWYVCVTGGICVWLIMYFYLTKKISSRLAKFEEQMPEAMDIIRRVLQAGQPLTQGFNEVGREMPAPIGIEFENTFNLLNYGYDMRLAIMQMADRSPTVSMLAFSSAVLLQKETGGNLSENLEKVSSILRARFKLARKIRTLSAESRLSAWILVLAPFVMFVGLKITNPKYIEPLTTEPQGLTMISVGFVLLTIGTFWIKKIISIEV